MTVTPSFTMSGSILAGMAEHRLEAIETDLAITAPGADRADVQAMVAQAERMCFVLDALHRSHSVERRSALNGQPLG